MQKVAEAGAIAFRIQEGSAFILAVTAKKNPRDWIFPKGHIDRGETPEQTAVRELEEEAGVEGEVVDYVGCSEFDPGGGPIEVQYYLVRFLREGGAREGRQVRWSSLDEVGHLLSFEDARRLLDLARPMIQRYF